MIFASTLLLNLEPMGPEWGNSMTRVKVLLSAVVGLILIAAGSISTMMIDVRSKGCSAPLANVDCQALDVVSQAFFLTGGMVLFVLVFFPIIVTLIYPDSRDERRRLYPQVPDEAIFEALVIKDWKKND